jgi:uncharacterized membrane protein YccC
MNTQSQQIEDDEISLIDILLFFKASGRNVLISMIGCFLVGVAYYFAVPKMYVATATIQVAMVAGELVETPAVLLEKIKLPLFFSSTALQACGSDGDLSSHTKFADKLKPAINKSASLISLSAQALSTQEARACLDAVISEIQKLQNDLAKPVIEQKKQKLTQLSDQLKAAEEMAKSFSTTKANNNATDAQVFARTLVMSSNLANASEISDLRRKINNLEAELIPPQTQPTSLAAPIFAPEVSNNKRPVFTLGLSLALGVFLGLVVTGVQRVVPEIRRQMREAEAKRV